MVRPWALTSWQALAAGIHSHPGAGLQRIPCDLTPDLHGRCAILQKRHMALLAATPLESCWNVAGRRRMY
jgi:hypothetical protein